MKPNVSRGCDTRKMGHENMAKWTVYKVRSLIAGGSGQSLEKLGTVDAGDYRGAMEAAHDAFKMEANPALPQGGLTVVAAHA
jgi:hypothetical protein